MPAMPAAGSAAVFPGMVRDAQGPRDDGHGLAEDIGPHLFDAAHRIQRIPIISPTAISAHAVPTGSPIAISSRSPAPRSPAT